MCSFNVEYQLINPSTQVALFSTSLEKCFQSCRISWNIYKRHDGLNGTSTQWKIYSNINSQHYYGENQRKLEKIHNFPSGANTTNFTATSDLFVDNPQIKYWRFEVVYAFSSKNSTSALNFQINQPPENGFCSIEPQNGTTSTLFTIFCSNWTDENGIQSYSLYGTNLFCLGIVSFSMFYQS